MLITHIMLPYIFIVIILLINPFSWKILTDNTVFNIGIYRRSNLQKMECWIQHKPIEWWEHNTSLFPNLYIYIYIYIYISIYCYCYCYFYLVESFHPIEELR